jgi:uncharacterized protein (TIGR01777 family)
MRLGITGASGFIGRHAARLAAARGWEVVPFSRQPRDARTRRFVPGEPADVDGLDAVLNLAGEPVVGRWTTGKRRRILESRVLGTRSIAEGFARAAQPPRVLVNASGIGYYGDTGDREVDENSPAGTGFLAEVCRAWEAEAMQVRNARVVILRIGLVLGREGGTIKRILPLFRAGLGGRLGSGRQWMSCIHIDDVVRLPLWAMEKENLSGPVNAVMPQPVTNASFTRALGAAVHRPAVLPAPAFVLRALLGPMSSLLLDSSRVRPLVPAENGYRYEFTDVADALDEIAH